MARLSPIRSKTRLLPKKTAARPHASINRRDFFRRSAAAIGGTALAGLLRPAKCLAGNAVKTGIGDVSTQIFKFNVHEPVVFAQNASAQAVTANLADYITQHRLLRNLTTEIAMTQLTVLQQKTFETWRRLPGNPLNVGANETFSELSWNRVFYTQLVTFLAQNGLVLLIEYPVITEHRAKGVDKGILEIGETYGLKQIEQQEAVAIDVWGKKLSASKLFIDENHPFIFRGQVLDPPQFTDFRAAARALYGNIIVYRQGFEKEITGNMRIYEQAKNLKEEMRDAEWEDHLDNADKYAANPLQFCALKLLSQELQQNFGEKELRGWMNGITFPHEIWHLYDDRTGFHKEGPSPTVDWQTHRQYNLRDVLNTELRGYFSGLRHCPAAYRKIDLRTLLHAFLELADKPEIDPNMERILFAFFDRFIGHLARNLHNFPQIVVVRHATVSRRKQIASQLYRLSGEQIGDIMESLFKEHDKEMQAGKSRPATKTLEEIYTDHWWDNNRGWALPVFGIGGTLAAGGIGLLIRGARRRSARRNQRLASIIQIIQEGLTEIDSQKIRAFAQVLLAQKSPNRRDIEKLAQQHGLPDLGGKSRTIMQALQK